MALFERIYGYLDLKQDIVDAPDAEPLDLQRVSGQITFDSVRVNYAASYDDFGDDDENKLSEAESRIWALDGVSLEIPCGMFGLLGPNGAGKSTLMRTIATLQKPDSGTIALDDINVLEDPDKLRHCLGYLPQEFGAYPRTSPEVMLNHIAVLKGITDAASRKKVVEQLLTRTNLWDVRKKSIDNFSGGMKQRFGIAQALIGDPKLIIADEPTAGLDPVERRRFHNAT